MYSAFNKFYLNFINLWQLTFLMGDFYLAGFPMENIHNLSGLEDDYGLGTSYRNNGFQKDFNPNVWFFEDFSMNVYTTKFPIHIRTNDSNDIQDDSYIGLIKDVVERLECSIVLNFAGKDLSDKLP